MASNCRRLTFLRQRANELGDQNFGNGVAVLIFLWRPRTRFILDEEIFLIARSIRLARA